VARSSGAAGPDTLYLVLCRQAVPPRSTHDLAADSKRILGNWIAVAHHDDAFLKEPRLTDKRQLQSVHPGS
jgi:lipocalin